MYNYISSFIIHQISKMGSHTLKFKNKLNMQYSSCLRGCL